MDYSSSPYKGMVTRWEAAGAGAGAGAAAAPPSQFHHHHQHHHHHHHQEWMMSSSNNNNNNSTKIEIEEDEEGGGGSKSVIEREHMFDKVVTPSDVGKLNRLVIPKQHAEKYFPLDSTTNEKGLLLNFEDRTGKPWRFRYSYWNSSQSYVMTKGWSRFVKEKKLDAGDIVSFQRGVGEVGKDKLFIDWRRRPDGSSGFLQHGRTVSAGAGVWGSGGGSPTFVLRSHPHLQPPPPPHYPYSYSPQGGAVWDHHQQQQQQSTPPHLSTMSLLNVLPSQSHPLIRRGFGGSNTGMGMGSNGFGYGNVVNPYPVTGSLIFLRSSSSSPSSPSVMSTTGSGEGSSSTVIPAVIHQQQQNGLSLLSEEDQAAMRMQVQREEGGGEPMVYESVPVVQGKAAAKRLRLFGVNMDCPISHQTHDFDILSSSLASSSTPNHHHHPYHHHHHHHHQQQQQHDASISMGPTLSRSSSSSPSQQHYPHPAPSQLSSRLNFYNDNNSPDKGKSSTQSSMSLDLDI